MAPPSTSTSAANSALSAQAPAASLPHTAVAAAAAAVAAAARGDNDSAALLWTLRANAVTPSKDPSGSTSDTSAAAFTTPTPASRPTTLLPASGSNATPPSGRRGPGRPKKSESGAKNAAKWDDHVTSLLLKFRYDDMKHAFEGVRNNVEVGECWITLAQELTRLSGKPFDSHQCQSKLRNLKKTYREMSASAGLVGFTATSPLQVLMGQYLGRDGGGSTSRRTSTGGSTIDATVTDASSGLTLPETRETAGTPQKSSSVSVEEAGAQVEEQVDNGLEVESVSTGEDTEDEDFEGQDGIETAHAGASSTSVKPLAAAGTAGAATVAIEAVAAPVTTRIRSEAPSSAAVPPPAKRQKHSEVTSGSAATTTTTTSAVIPAAVASVAANLSSGRIDSSLLSVVSGLRTMVEDVIASKEESSEQQQILAELRTHNALMKQYTAEVSKQTKSLNALIALIGAKFGSDP